MAYEYVKFSCGHEKRIRMDGNCGKRQKNVERLQGGICWDCENAETAKRLIAKGYIPRQMPNSMYNKSYSKFFKSNYDESTGMVTVYFDPESYEQYFRSDLPALEGTERQILWAAEIRKSLVDLMEKSEKTYAGYSDENKKKTEQTMINGRDALAYILKHKTSAKWYIDQKADGKSLHKILFSVLDELDANDNKSSDFASGKTKEKDSPPVPETKLLVPEETLHEEFVEVECKENRIRARYKYDDDFRNVMYDLHYQWDPPFWSRRTNYKTGSTVDRAAELINVLLQKGFKVRLEADSGHDDIKSKAEQASYETEHLRWIELLADGDIGITWGGGNEELYRTAKRLPKASWSKPYVYVSPRYYEAIRDFAEHYGFHISAAAEKALTEAEERTVAERLAPKKKSKTKDKGGLKEILESEGVVDDLIDQ